MSNYLEDGVQTVVVHSAACRLVQFSPPGSGKVAKWIANNHVLSLRSVKELKRAARDVLMDPSEREGLTGSNPAMPKAEEQFWVGSDTSRMLKVLRKLLLPDQSSSIHDDLIQTTLVFKNRSPAPHRWLLAPLEFYNSTSSEGSKVKEHRSSVLVALLQFYQILMCQSSSHLLTCPPWELFMNISHIFRMDASTWLDERVIFHLNTLLWRISELCTGPPPANFMPFYGRLLESFIAQSYGNEVFAHALLWPLKVEFGPGPRLVFWKRALEVGRLIKDITPRVNLDKCSATGDSAEIREQILLALTTKSFSKRENQWLYKVAIDTLRRYLSSSPSDGKAIMRRLKKFAKASVVEDVER